MAEPRQQIAGQQRIDVVVLGDQDGKAARRVAAGPAITGALAVRSARAAPAPNRAASEAARTGLTR